MQLPDTALSKGLKLSPVRRVPFGVGAGGWDGKRSERTQIAASAGPRVPCGSEWVVSLGRGRGWVFF